MIWLLRFLIQYVFQNESHDKGHSPIEPFAQRLVNPHDNLGTPQLKALKPVVIYPTGLPCDSPYTQHFYAFYDRNELWA